MDVPRSSRTTRIVTLLAAVAVALAGTWSARAPVNAGGWATVELDRPVGEVHAGERVTIGFMVLQHGVTPYADGTPRLSATSADDGTSVTADGIPLGDEGHYALMVVFPEPGRWDWEIKPSPFPDATSLPTLTVLAPGESASTTAAPAAADNMKEIGVSIRDSAFSPSLLNVGVGMTVTWTNEDVIKHGISFDDPVVDDSGILDTGDTFSFTFTKPGTYRYHCGPHPSMTGEVVVS